MPHPAKPYLILKYFYYTSIQDPAHFREVHHQYCLEKHLLGRIKIATEGINGTLSGLVANCQAYMQHLQHDPRFHGIEFNITPSHTHVHHKLHVRLKEEIIASGTKKPLFARNHQPGKQYIDPPTFAHMRTRKDVVVLDVRSNYEHKLGKFHNAVTFDIKNFKSFFSQVQKHTFDKQKQYVVVCTRGIKSVKAWRYLKEERKLPHVFYLKGGVLDYAQQTDGNGFLGACYVFDHRPYVLINSKHPTSISRCHHCKQASMRMVNCANPICDLHTTMCEACSKAHAGACSVACRQHPQKRPYNGTGQYAKKMNGYNPFLHSQRHKPASRAH